MESVCLRLKLQIGKTLLFVTFSANPKRKKKAIFPLTRNYYRITSLTAIIK